MVGAVYGGVGVTFEYGPVTVSADCSIPAFQFRIRLLPDLVELSVIGAPTKLIELDWAAR